MNYNINNKIYCKKNHNIRPEYKMGMYYSVSDSMKNSICIETGTFFKDGTPKNYWFTTKKSLIEDEGAIDTWDYFYTKKELRKTKLKKLNEK